VESLPLPDTSLEELGFRRRMPPVLKLVETSEGGRVLRNIAGKRRTRGKSAERDSSERTDTVSTFVPPPAPAIADVQAAPPRPTRWSAAGRPPITKADASPGPT
jgi:hypothetical protein